LWRPRTVLLLTVVMAVGALAGSFVLTPTYRATAVVRALWEPPDETETRRRDVDRTSRHVAAMRRLVLGLQTPEASSATVAAKGKDAFAIECVHPDPEAAALVSNRLARLLVAEVEKERTTVNGTDSRPLESRLLDAERDLQEKRAALRRFLAENPPAFRPAGDQSVPDRAEAKSQVVGDEPPEAGSDPARVRLSPQAEGRDAAGAGRALDQLQEAHADRPTELETVTLRSQRLEAQTPQGGGLSRQAAARQRKLDELARDLESAQATYTSTLAEWRTAEITSRLGRGTAPVRVDVVEFAHKPEKAFFPNRLLFAIAGLVLGLALGAAAAVAAGLRDTSVKDQQDLEAFLSLPVLVTIDEVGRRRRAPTSRRGR